jgi:choline kinase/phosphatidylglycerophosphate synthase
MTILSQYRSALKRPEAEEVLDLVIFRPIAFAISRALIRTPATPNGITASALVAALCSGVLLSLGTRDGFVAGALFYALANVLDCCDGMVARLKGSGTQLGRMVDVFADTLSGMAVYVGLGIGLSAAATPLPAPAWLLVAIGGASYAMQAALFDRARNRYLARFEGGRFGIEREVAAVNEAITRDGSLVRRALGHAYVRYMRWQDNGIDAVAPTSTMLRLWSVFGSTSHVAVVVVALLAGAPQLIFAWTIIAGNLWALGLWLVDPLVADDADALRGAPSRSKAGEETIAVVLAAGAGTRLRPLTNIVPKPLVEVGGRALLGRSIDALVEAGIRRFVVIAGYRAARVEEFLAMNYPQLDIEIVFNRHYETSNNAASLLHAAPSFAGERMLLVDGDLLYDAAIVRELLAGELRGARLVVRRSGDLAKEEMKVALGRDGRIARVAKTIPPRASAGESVGIALLDASSTARLFRTLERRMQLDGGADEFYEAAFQQLIDEGESFSVFDARGRVCIEIDTVEDHADAEIAVLADGAYPTATRARMGWALGLPVRSASRYSS